MEKVGLKDRLRYRDVSWLMPGVDVMDVLARLGSETDHVSGREVRAFCPDHHIYTGRAPSHANWTVNTRTGETMCFTEGRGSNLVWTVCRVLDCGTRDAVAFLTNRPGDLDMGELAISSILSRASKARRPEEEERQEVRGLDVIAREMANRHMSEQAYRFFVHPPEKPYPTDISKETVDYHWVFERTWGYYSGRVVVPFVMKGLVVGFCALDIEGKTAWLRRRPGKTEDDYRKVLYPSGFVSGKCLFGYDDCRKGADFLVLVEGAREKMKLWQEGFADSAAILGSYMSDGQMELLTSLMPKKVVLMFDGDGAGTATTERVAEKLSRHYAPELVKRCFVPRGKDPKNLRRADFERLVFGR